MEGRSGKRRAGELLAPRPFTQRTGYADSQVVRESCGCRIGESTGGGRDPWPLKSAIVGVGCCGRDPLPLPLVRSLTELPPLRAYVPRFTFAASLSQPHESRDSAPVTSRPDARQTPL